MKATLKFILFVLCLALTAKLVLYYKSHSEMGCRELMEHTMEKIIEKSF